MSKMVWASLTGLVTLLTGILIAIATWWISGVNAHMGVVDDLKARSIYLHGAFVVPEATPFAPK